MDARSANLVVPTATAEKPPLSVLIRCLIWTLVVVFSVVALIMVARRWAGGPARPLGGLSMVSTGVTLAALAAAVRAAWPASQESIGGWGKQILLWIPASAVVLISWSISLPGSSLWALCIMWAILLVEESVSICRLLRHGRHPIVSFQRGRVPSVVTRTAIAAPVTDGILATKDVDRQTGLPEYVCQQITYARDGDGAEVFYGRLRGEFVMGQRTTSLHIAFCPPLDSTPELIVEQIDGPEVIVKPSQVLPYGAKLDLNLKSVSPDRQSVVIEFYARSPKQ